MNYFCCTETRRNAVKEHPLLNGIDFLEVLDVASDPFEERQTTLFVHFLKPLPAIPFDVDNFTIEGGERITGIGIVSVVTLTVASFPSAPPPGADRVLVIKVNKAGDFSNYTLNFVDSGGEGPPDGFDSILSSVTFSFKVSCPTDFDCEPISDCQPEPFEIPEISYLAKDFASFKQLMLDRMSLIMPEWTERNPADLGITLVELLAYTADYLSYRQDAIATEAYLGTARKRISVRRHARLIDYYMHDGCNARTWLHVQVGPGVSGLTLEAGEWENRTKVISKIEDLAPAIRLDSEEFEQAVNANVLVYELMHDIDLFTEHNEMPFYTWGDRNCCLPKGATSATLKGNFPNLKVGDVLIFCEKYGPITGDAQDADPAKRHAVRLTNVTTGVDVLFDAEITSPPGSPPADPGLAITDIEWHSLDALPFPLCISSSSDEGYIEEISIALGNNVLADHGQSFADAGEESTLLPSLVPEATLKYASTATEFCDSETGETIRVRYNPSVEEVPLTQITPFNIDELEYAGVAFERDVRLGTPVIELIQTDEEGEEFPWLPQKDLLSSAATKKEFVVEIEEDGSTFIRFGDDVLGAFPASGSTFKCKYRIGNGPSGNIGSSVLQHLVTNDASIISNMPEGVAAVWNPMPAKGGKRPESKEEVRQYAPQAFRTQERAVTSADYEEFAQKCDEDVQRAAATFRWTGSWKTVFLTVDRFGGDNVDAGFENDLRACLEKYRMAGFDLEVDDPIFVSLNIAMTVCVKPKFIASDVKRELLNVFSNRQLSNGKKGVFHPDNFSFGETVYLSRLYAAAQAVQGVATVQITKFQRQGQDDLTPINEGKLTLERREIARCDNDPNFPERGAFSLSVGGGRF